VIGEIRVIIDLRHIMPPLPFLSFFFFFFLSLEFVDGWVGNWMDIKNSCCVFAVESELCGLRNDERVFGIC